MNVKRIITGLAGLVLAAGLAGGLATSAQASGLPVVYGMPYGHSGSNFVNGKVRPTGNLVWTGDGSGWFVIHSYRSWSGSNAWANATLHARSCWGTCFQFKTERVTLHFYQVKTHNRHRYFTRLSFSDPHRLAGQGPSETLKFFSRGSPAWYYSWSSR